MWKDEFDLDVPMARLNLNCQENFDHMADGLIDEFIGRNLDEESMWQMFRDPYCRSTNAILRERGEAYVGSLIRRGFARCCLASLGSWSADI